MNPELTKLFQNAAVSLLNLRNALVEHPRDWEWVNRLGCQLGEMRRKLECEGQRQKQS